MYRNLMQGHRLVVVWASFCLVYVCLPLASCERLNPFAIGLRSAIASNASHGRRFNSNQRKSLYDHEINERSIWSNPEYEESEDWNNNGELVETVSRTSTRAKKVNPNSQMNRGGATSPALSFHENMICGAISRSLAQVATHPANTMKTLLQSNRQSGSNISIMSLARPENAKMLTRGVGAQLMLSIPHGAVNFATLEYVRKKMSNIVSRSEWASEKQQNSAAFGPLLDFCSSAIATVCCSVISTPQMMIVDNIMAGTYENFPKAVIGLSKDKGIMGFYGGWWPGLVGKIPSYALTWTLFQQLKQAQLRIMQRPPKDVENSMMGCMASAITVTVMIPMDTIKTRLVTQLNYPDLVPYKGIIDAANRIAKEEGIKTFYRGLPPRLISVVPMIGIQFGVYEFMKKTMIDRRPSREMILMESNKLEEVMMEVAADDDQPFPVPHMFEEEKK